MGFLRRVTTGRDGNTAILALISLTLLAGLAMAQFTVTRRSVQRSDFFLSRVELRRYAESGVAMAYHYLRYNIDGGQIGTADWDADFDDLGADGVGGTADRGEGDGIPTPGEPNLAPVTVGASGLGANLLVYVSDTGFAGVKRIVATSFTVEESVTLEKQVKETVVQIPRPGSVYVDPAVALNLTGNSFLIDGNDTNPDGTPGPDPAEYGLATAVGAVPGDNQAALLAQIGAQQEDNVTGQGADPSIGEITAIDIGVLVAQFYSSPHQSVESGTHTNVTWGDWAADNMVTTFVQGDLHVSGQGSGAGVLVVDGDLTISGQFTFMGLIIATGDIRLAGGGTGVHVWGTVMTQGAIDAVDPEVELLGTAELRYSSVVLDRLEQTASQSAGYETVYYGERTY